MVLNGLAQIYAAGSRSTSSTASASTPPGTSTPASSGCGSRRSSPRRGRSASRLPDLRRGDAHDAVDLSTYVRDRGLPQVLDFPFQEAATRLRLRGIGREGRRAPAHRRRLLPHGERHRPVVHRRSSATTTWGAPRSRSDAGPGPDRRSLLQHVLLGYDVLYLLRGAPAVLYGDEVGMIGSGGDQQARQDMFPTQVSDWQTQAARRLAADREGLVVRRHGQSDPGTAAHALGDCGTRIPSSRQARRSFATRRTAYSSSRVSTWRRARRSSSASTTGRPLHTSRSRRRRPARPGASPSARGRPPGRSL